MKRRRLLYSLYGLIAVLFIGTIGFTFYEPTVHNPAEALYFTLVTMTTVGYGDLVPTTGPSRIIASIVMVGGIGAGIVALQSLFDTVISKGIREELGLPERRTKMKNHFIVCGYGHVGKQIADQLGARGEEYIVIEKNKEKVSSLVEEGIPVIEGDAIYEEVLTRANIQEARALLATMSDMTNVMVVLTAKMLNPNLHVVAEVEDTRNTLKLRRAGADEVVHCHELGARIMVSKARRIELDPVCGAEIDPTKVSRVAQYGGKNFYFCSEECAEAFKKNPERFIELQKTLDMTCQVKLGLD
ncbi:MAG: NAD-binding protein [Methanomassiliicoccales archaeon]